LRSRNGSLAPTRANYINRDSSTDTDQLRAPVENYGNQ